MQGEGRRLRGQPARPEVHPHGADGPQGAGHIPGLAGHGDRGQKAGARLQQRRRIPRPPGQVVQGRCVWGHSVCAI